MRNVRLRGRVLGVEYSAVIEAVAEDDDSNAIVVPVRPSKGNRSRSGRCRRRSPGYDAGEGRRRWRSLDARTIMAFIEADAPRVSFVITG